jgi:nucleotide-binding universal stress UspA family protein
MKIMLGVAQRQDGRLVTRFVTALGLPRGTTIYLMHVVEAPTLMRQLTRGVADNWKRQATADARTLISRLIPSFSRQGLNIRSLIKVGRPGPIILNAVERTAVDLTVVSPHRSSRLANMFLGSVTEMLLEQAPSSVLVVRDRSQGQRGDTMKILLAMDFSTDAQAAANFFLKLCQPGRCHILLLYVEETFDTVFDRMSRMDTQLPTAIENAKCKRKQRMRLLLDRMGHQLAQRGYMVDKVWQEGNPASHILRFAERRKADLIVMGAKGLTGLERYILGSVSRRVARHAICSVLVVKKRK